MFCGSVAVLEDGFAPVNNQRYEVARMDWFMKFVQVPGHMVVSSTEKEAIGYCALEKLMRSTQIDKSKYFFISEIYSIEDTTFIK